MGYSEARHTLEWQPTEGARCILRVLADGQWHRTADLSALIGGKAQLERQLMDCPSIAESDSGQWWCIPDRRTPLLAPDDLYDVFRSYGRRERLRPH